MDVRFSAETIACWQTWGYFNIISKKVKKKMGKKWIFLATPARRDFTALSRWRRDSIKSNHRFDADFADYADLLAGLGSLGLARLDVNIRQSQNLRPQAISTNGRQKLCKPAPLQLGHTLKV